MNLLVHFQLLGTIVYGPLFCFELIFVHVLLLFASCLSRADKSELSFKLDFLFQSQDAVLLTIDSV